MGWCELTANQDVAAGKESSSVSRVVWAVYYLVEVLVTVCFCLSPRAIFCSLPIPCSSEAREEG